MLAPGYGPLLVHVSFQSVYKAFKFFNILARNIQISVIGK